MRRSLPAAPASSDRISCAASTEAGRRRGRARQPRGAGPRRRQPELPEGVELDRRRRRRPRGRRPRARGRRPGRPPRGRGRRRPVDVRDRALHRARTRWPPRASSSAWSSRAPCRPAWSSPRRCRSTARASTSAPSTGASRRRRAPRSSSSPASGSAPARVRRELEPVPTSERKPLIPTSIYAITKRDHEELCSRHRRGLRDPDRRPALLQRLRAGAGALQPVHRRRGDLRVAAAERQPAGDLRGRRAVARLHPRERHRRGNRARARVRGRCRPRRQPRHRPPVTVSEVADALAHGLGVDLEPSGRASTARATSATATPTRARAGSCSASTRL